MQFAGGMMVAVAGTPRAEPCAAYFAMHAIAGIVQLTKQIQRHADSQSGFAAYHLPGTL